MIGLPELIILIVIVLVVFAGYFRKRLPEFGRKAGTSARVGTEKARELVDTTSGKVSEGVGKAGESVGERLDPTSLGRSAGRGVREARDLRDSFKEAWDAPGTKPAKPGAEAEGPQPDPEAPPPPPGAEDR